MVQDLGVHPGLWPALLPPPLLLLLLLLRLYVLFSCRSGIKVTHSTGAPVLHVWRPSRMEARAALHLQPLCDVTRDRLHPCRTPAPSSASTHSSMCRRTA
jgi:hypothetical protein